MEVYMHVDVLYSVVSLENCAFSIIVHWCSCVKARRMKVHAHLY